MMSVLSDVSLRRAGFDTDLRDRIAAAWRAEDYTTAGNLIPDELLDAFMLCGTREEVAAGAMAYHARAGLGLPLLQPVLQEDRQIDELIAAAALYADLPEPAGSLAADHPVAVGAGRTAADGADAPSLAGDRRLGTRDRARRRAGAVWEILRPFAFTASAIPVIAGGALAWVDGFFAWAPFLAALAGAVLLHAGTNIVNEVYDVRKGIDSITSPRASHAIVKGRMTERSALLTAGIALRPGDRVRRRAHVHARPGDHRARAASGSSLGWGYTAPPLEYKNRALGVPIVFVLMGPLMVVGGYFAASGDWSSTAFWLSVPIGLPDGRDPARQRVARHPRGHARRASRRCPRGSAGAGRTTATWRSSSARTWSSP